VDVDGGCVASLAIGWSLFVLCRPCFAALFQDADAVAATLHEAGRGRTA
jgi:hypothetical protein